jgi:Domain of unknown function (DUF4249)
MQKSLIITIIVFFLSQGCGFEFKETITLPDNEPELAVYADLSNENGFSVYVVKKRVPNEVISWDFNNGDSVVDLATNKVVFVAPFSGYIKSVSLLNPFYDVVKNVKVEVFEEGKFLVELKPEYKPLPHYVNYDKVLKPGKKYQLEISAPNYPKVTGEQIATSDIIPRTITFIKDGYRNVDNGLLSEIIVDIDDPIDEQNSYLLSCVVQKTDRKTGKLQFNQVPIYKIDPTSTTNNIISDISFNGKSFKWRLGANVDAVLKDTIDKDLALGITFFPINQDLEKYYRTLEAKENNYSNALSEPITPFSNLKGGVGIFSTTGKYTTKNFIIK